MKSAAPPKRCRKGFSLVEVNLAILLVALGMVTIFGLFPAGLREGELAVTDTHVALFADFVLEGVRANASTTTNWFDWRSMKNPVLPASMPLYQLFRVKAVANINIDKFDNPPDGTVTAALVIQDPTRDPPAGVPIAVSGPVLFSGSYVNYILEVTGDDYRDASARRRTVSFWVLSGEHVTKDVARFKSLAKFFYTEFFFPGSMP